MSSNLCYANEPATSIIDIVWKLKLSLEGCLSSQLAMVGFCSTLLSHLSLVHVLSYNLLWSIYWLTTFSGPYICCETPWTPLKSQLANGTDHLVGHLTTIDGYFKMETTKRNKIQTGRGGYLLMQQIQESDNQMCLKLPWILPPFQQYLQI